MYIVVKCPSCGKIQIKLEAKTINCNFCGKPINPSGGSILFRAETVQQVKGFLISAEKNQFPSSVVEP